MPDELTFTLDADGATRIDSASLERSAQAQLQRRAASVLMMIQRREVTAEKIAEIQAAVDPKARAALDEIARIDQELGLYP